MTVENFVYLMLGISIGFFLAIPIVASWHKTDAEIRMNKHILDEHEKPFRETDFYKGAVEHELKKYPEFEDGKIKAPDDWPRGGI